MRRLEVAGLVAFAVISLATMSGAQENAQKNIQAGQNAATTIRQSPLVLSGSVPLEGVKGRFDHFAAGKGRIFVSALGNNTIEVISMFGGIVEHTISGVPNSQGVAFSPEANKLFVASAKGKVYIYDGDSFGLITSVDFEGGADNLRYDPSTKRVKRGGREDGRDCHNRCDDQSAARRGI